MMVSSFFFKCLDTLIRNVFIFVILIASRADQMSRKYQQANYFNYFFFLQIELSLNCELRFIKNKQWVIKILVKNKRKENPRDFRT